MSVFDEKEIYWWFPPTKEHQLRINRIAAVQNNKAYLAATPEDQLLMNYWSPDPGRKKQFRARFKLWLQACHDRKMVDVKT
jgi:hypothetical protein